MSTHNNPDPDTPRSVARGNTVYIISDIGNDYVLLTPNNRGNKGERKVAFKESREKVNRIINRFK